MIIFNSEINCKSFNLQKILLLFVLSSSLLSSSVVNIFAQSNWEVEILDNPSPGYIGFNWYYDSTMTLMDNYGNFPITKSVSKKLTPFKLLDNGLWISFSFNYLYLLDQDYRLVDSIPKPENYSIDAHDVILLANGHYLLLCTEITEMDLSQIIEGAKTNASIGSHVIIETDNTGQIYWQWKSLDHYDILDYPEYDDLKQKSIDFTHANSLFEDSDGNILVSMRSLDEVTKIDKNTGNILWRLGGKMCRNNEFTFVNDTIDDFYGFSHQHSISVLPNGNILLFDNGNLKPYQYTRAVEYKLNLEGNTATKVWEYRTNPDTYIGSMGSVKRLPNGNTMLNFGGLNTPKSFFLLELKPDNTIALKLKYTGEYSPSLLVFTRYITKMDAVTKNINSAGFYQFNDSKYNTGMDLQVNNVVGGGLVSVEKHNYAPSEAIYIDSNFVSVLPFRWVLNRQNISSISGTIKLKVDAVSGLEFPEKLIFYYRVKESKGIFTPLNTSYDKNTRVISAPINSFGEFVLVSQKLAVPTLIYPQNKQNGLSDIVSLKWNKLQGATHYRIQTSNSIEMLNLKIDTIIVANSNVWEFKNLNSNTNYFWRIQGINSKDTTSWSNIFEFTTSNFDLVIPKLVSPENNLVGFENQDTLTWNDVAGIDYFTLQISDDSEFISENKIVLLIESNYYVAKDLDPNKIYYWRVNSVVNDKVSLWSEVRSFTTKIATPILFFPNNEQFNIELKDTMSWQIIDKISNYHLQLSKFDNFAEILIDSIGINSTRFAFQSLEYNTKYFWRVRALNNADTSNWSEIRSFSTLLSTPNLILPVNKQKGVNSTTNFEWTSVSGGVSFEFQLADNSEFANPFIDSTTVSSKILLSIELEFNKEYFWRVRANNNQKQSKWSGINSFISELKKPLILSPVANAVDVDVNTLLIWYDQYNYNSYMIQVSEDITFSTYIIDTVQKNTTEFSIELSPLTTYYLRIKAEASKNFSSWSDVVKFRTKSATYIEEIIEQSYMISPNPAIDYIIIKPSDNFRYFETYNVRILDLLGIDVKSMESTYLIQGESLRIDVSKLPAGVYFIRVGDKVEKFVKIL